MHAARLIAILVGCLPAALTGCCAVPSSNQADWPIVMRPSGGGCCSACGEIDSSPIAECNCGAVDETLTGDHCGFRPGIAPALAGLLTFEEPGLAVPPPHDPWFVAVPTCPVLPVADTLPVDAVPPVGPPVMIPIQPGPVYEPVPPPAEQPPPAQEQQAPGEDGPPRSNAPTGRDAIQQPGAPALLNDYRPGVGWTFRPAHNHALDNSLRAVQRAPGDSASKPRSNRAF